MLAQQNGVLTLTELNYLLLILPSSPEVTHPLPFAFPLLKGYSWIKQVYESHLLSTCDVHQWCPFW